MDDDNYSAAQMIAELTEQVEGYKETNGRLIDDGCALRRTIENQRSELHSAREMHMTVYDEKQTLHGQNQTLRAEVKRHATITQRWVDKYEDALRDNEGLATLAGERLVTIDRLEAQLDTMGSNGWGSDLRLQELEEYATVLQSASNGLIDELDAIRTGR